jgi:hypothetical protein
MIAAVKASQSGRSLMAGKRAGEELVSGRVAPALRTNTTEAYRYRWQDRRQAMCMLPQTDAVARRG